MSSLLIMLHLIFIKMRSAKRVYGVISNQFAMVVRKLCEAAVHVRKLTLKMMADGAVDELIAC